MDVFVYDAIFGYVNHIAVVWCVFILWKDLANPDDARYGAVMRFMRFRYLLYWHPGQLQPVTTWTGGYLYLMR